MVDVLSLMVRRSLVRWLLTLVVAGGPAWALAATAPPLEALRHALAVDPIANGSRLDATRQQAIRQGDLSTRLAVDELDCRTQADLNMPRSLAVAEAGLATVPAEPPEAARDAWLRLRVCRAASRLALAQRDEGYAELDQLIALAAPGTTAWALARMERGAGRSRANDWAAAQEDLVAACDALQRLGSARDTELCLGQLASHYQRVNDFDEALRLMSRLHQTIAARGEDYDASIVAYNIASLYVEQERWDDALRTAREAESASIRLKDVLGQGYAGRVIVLALMRKGQVDPAMERAHQALTQVDQQADAREHAYLSLLYVELLAQAGQPAQALKVLDDQVRRVPPEAEAGLRESLARAQAAAYAAAGRWQEAYEARTAEGKIAESRHRKRMSDQAARLGQQFNRDRDAKELAVLRQLAERERQLRQTQAVALTLFGVLLLAVGLLVVRKFRQVRRLQGLASTDELTGLMNRRALTTHAEQTLRRAQRFDQPMALLMVDIDHFKRINDTYGHAAGDAVLRHVAAVLSHALRAGDRLGRVGGEEFVAVLEQADADAAALAAERMRAAVEHSPMAWGQGSLGLTISIGLATREPGDLAEPLIARADAALYRAKAAGRNTVAR